MLVEAMVFRPLANQRHASNDYRYLSAMDVLPSCVQETSSQPMDSSGISFVYYAGSKY